MAPIEPAAITAAALLDTKALEAVGSRVGEHAWAGMGRLRRRFATFGRIWQDPAP
jgi:hypothetical protein